MGKKVVILVVLWVACITVIHAAGRKENESREADNPEGFTSSIPIENKRTGKYNFYIEAKDKANNKTLAGPHNMYVDPVSDLPVTRIINPRPNMHIQGNLNIVGSCMDDDGVDHVEFVVTRGADGKGEELVRDTASGGEFWYYYLETTDMEIWTDGVYTITAWGVDINGLSGISDDFRAKDRKFHRVSWNLDRKKPQIRVTSHEVGDFVTGKINVKGSIFDGNGVKSLNYSLDEGSTYRPLGIKYDKRRDTYFWETAIDTKAFEDGPKVVWFKAVDGMGTMGLYAHLLFINNTTPEIEILYPAEDDAVSSVFTLAVYAAHPVGLKSLTWKLGKDSGEFPRIIGNSWWIQEFDIRAQKANSLDLEIRAEDLSGNVTTVKRKLKVDQNASLPVVSLEEPAAGISIDGESLNVKGTASDKDAVASILYSINSGASVEIPCSGYFQFTIAKIPPGTSNIDIWAKNIYGIEGPKVQVKGITAPGPLPEPRIASISGGDSKASPRDFYTGMEIQPRMVMDFAVKSGNALTGASISFAGQPAIPLNPRTGRDGLYHADVPLPAELSPGLIKIELTASDRLGREGVWVDYFYTASFGSSTFEWVRPVKTKDERVVISAADEILMGLGGLPLSSASVSGSGAENVRVEVDEYGRVQLRAQREGSFGPLSLTVSPRNGGANFRSETFTILADFAPPAIKMAVPGFVQGRVPLQFTVADSNKIMSADYSTDLGGTWQSLLTTSQAAALSPGELVRRVLDISSFPDGVINIQIRVVDEAEHVTIEHIYPQKDTVAPEAELIMPISEARVNGAIRLGITVKEAGSIKSVTYQRPEADGAGAISKVVYPYPDTYNENGEKIYRHPARFLNILTDPTEMPLDYTMRLIIEDEAGNRTQLNRWPFIIDNEMDIPVAQIVLPLENEVITADFEVSGVCFDDDAIGAVYWRIDNGTGHKLETTGNGFSVPIALSSLTDNEHSVTIVPEDIYGVRGRPVRRNFKVSLSEPVSAITTPSFDMINSGIVEISGGAFDENGISKVQISIDNGNTFNDTRLNAYDNTAEWFYEFNSQILKDGAHVIFTRVYDKYDISAMYASLLNIDNTPPELTIDSPENGMITTGPISILGKVSDVNLEAKSVELRSLEGVRVPGTFSIYRPGMAPMIRESMDISSLRNGLYNLEIQAIDKAGNTTIISRNIELAQESQRNFVNVLYPLNGEYVQGFFNLYGVTGGNDKAGTVILNVNGTDVRMADVTWTDFYCFSLSGEYLREGWNELVVHSDFGGNDSVKSEKRNIYYQPDGAWVTIDSLTMGDFAYERPWFTGRAGYALNEEELQILADKGAEKELLAEIRGKTPDYVDISFDNGGTFVKTGRGKGKDSDWSYRLETGEMAEGLHFIIVRANMKNGETAVTRTVLQVDKTPPKITLIAPQPGGRYNQELEFSALASDDSALASLTYHLRAGDKALYEVPGFLQGLYFEGTIPPFIKQAFNEAPNIFGGGATYFDAGMGLSFFDDNVKIQVQYGRITQDLYEALGQEGPLRYGGHVLGLKLLANIYALPFGKMIGPDWEWLSASLALGANFSLFDLAHEENSKFSRPDNPIYYTQSGSSTWMSALLMQLEFPKVTIPRREYLRTFSMFTEGQLWFVPTDVDASKNNIKVVIPHVIVGLRMYIF
ncbi:MAG: Ig-like domain repeat protein [Treponema sp.]|jgi:hypothetical protein|nr:Ig-like domain repeat protein [Treponema sp.]